MNKKRTGKIIIFCLIAILMLSAFLVETNIVKATEIVGEGQKFNAGEEVSVEVQLEQSVEKYFNITENQFLLQQKIIVSTNQGTVKKEKERLQIVAPEILETKPELAILLVDGKKANEKCYTYDAEKGELNIEVDNNTGIPSVYKVVYGYNEITAEQQEIKLNTKAYTKFENIDEEKEAIDEKTLTIEPMGEKVSVEGKITNEVYKGYLYESKENETIYQEDYVIEISNMQEIENIKITNEAREYTYYQKTVNKRTKEETEDRIGVQVKDNVYFKTTEINKDNMIEVLGEEGKIVLKNQNDEVLAEITKDSESDENGNIVVTYENNQVLNIKLETTKPEEIGTLTIKNTKAIGANIGYTREELKNLQFLEETVTANESTATLKMELLETNSEIKLDVNKEQLSTVIENKDVQISLTLKSDSNNYDLYKNPTIRLELPADVEQLNVNSINKLYGDEFNVGKAYQEQVDGKFYINIELQGEQTEYKELALEGIKIVINANITLNKIATSKNDNIVVKVTNEFASEAKEEIKEVSIVSPKELITSQNVQELGIETIGEEDVISTKVEKAAAEKTIKVESEIINNNDGKIKDVAILGSFGTDGKIQIQDEEKENNMGIVLASGLSVETIDSSKIKIYYTENSNATVDLENPENGWNEQITDASKTSKYLIIVSDMEKAEGLKTSYQVVVPANLEYNQEAFQGYETIYTSEATGEQGNVKATTVKLETGKGPVLEAYLTAKVGNKQINENSKIKQGEVIRYQIEVKNTGTEDATNIVVKGNVPQGTVAVEPMEDFQYFNGKYYEEVDIENYEFNIGELKVGESVTETYEVRVKNDTAVGTQITNVADIEYHGVQKSSNEFSNIVEEAKLRVSIKTTTDSDLLSEGEIIGYQAIIENISDEEQKDITLNWNLPEVYKINQHFILGKEENYKDNTESYINIDSIEANEKVIVDLNVIVNNQEGVDKNSLTATVNQGEETYNSNELLYQVRSLKNVDIKIQATNEKNYVKPGDVIEYTITVVNNNEVTTNVSIYDSIPTELTVTRVTYNGEEQVLNQNANDIEIKDKELQAGEEVVIKVYTLVNISDGIEEFVEISNQATVWVWFEEIESNTVLHTIEYDINSDNSDDSSNSDDSDNNNGGNTTEDTKTYNISGKVWVDEDADGQMEDSEQTISGIDVYLMNVNTNKTVVTVTTDEQGNYTLKNIPVGKYIVVFDYDSSKYTLTAYEKEGVDVNKTSKVVSKKITLNNREKYYGVTDSIEISERSIGNINMGLVKSKEFDLKLEKTVNKIIVQNSKETKIYNYENASLAKVEIPAKTINNTNVIVEYQIKVTNQGELDGYAKKIVDYIPEGLKFSSELNKDWYQSDNSLYNSTLANEKIMPGESKVITLSLIKTMTSEETGTYTNIAEIAEDYNDAGVVDINSVPNNKKDGENDISKAELILAVSTGKIAMYIMLFSISTMILATGIYFIKTKILDSKE